MEAVFFSENLLFAVFRCHDTEWRYFNPMSATTQQGFDAIQGHMITIHLPGIRNNFFQRMEDDQVPMYLTEDGFDNLAQYAAQQYPAQNGILTRLLCIACLCHYFTSHGIGPARTWGLWNVWDQLAQNPGLLGIYGA